MATGSNILAWKNSMDRGAWRAHGVAELDTTGHTRTHAHNRRVQYAELLREVLVPGASLSTGMPQNTF